MRISTIIPAYNRADLIGETLRSVLSQSRAPDEVIVVDDGSTDGTADAVVSFGRAVRLIRQANAGAGMARNAGFAASVGEIVHFMDSDDLVGLETYSAAAAALASGADMAYGAWLKTRIEGRTLTPEPVALQQGPIASRRDLATLALLVEWVTLLQSCLFRRETVGRAGQFRADLKPSEDTEWLCRVATHVGRADHVPEMLLLYRLHPENQVSAQNPARILADRAALWKVLDDHCAQRGGLSPAARRVFTRKKLDIAYDVRASDPAAAIMLARGVPTIIQALRPVRRMAQRIMARARLAATGDPYPRVFAARPLRDEQRAEIAKLGYALG